jgi:hypothetical protein
VALVQRVAGADAGGGCGAGGGQALAGLIDTRHPELNMVAPA